MAIAEANNKVRSYFNSILNILIERGAIPEQMASQVSPPNNQGEIVDRLLEQEVPAKEVASAIAAKNGFVLYSPEEHGAPELRGSDWLLANETMFLINPLGPRAEELLKRNAKNDDGSNNNASLKFSSWGVCSADIFDSSIISNSELDVHTVNTNNNKATEHEAHVKLIEIIESAIASNASDIHLDPYQKVARVKFRIDGRLQIREEIELSSLYIDIANILLNMSKNEPGSFSSPKDGQFKWDLTNRSISIRLGMIPSKIESETYPKFTLRLLGLETNLSDVDKLGLAKKDTDRLKRIVTRPNGLMLVTGPTGSGKTTTLYALLRYHYQHSPDKSFFTLEDPVEVPFPGFNQTEVNDAANMSFSAGLRSLLRLDPDVILVGEIRDQETAELAVKASLTGHTVLSTLHTNSAIDTIPRLLNIGIDKQLLGDSLIGITAQRVVPTLCPNCASEHSFAEVLKSYPSLKQHPDCLEPNSKIKVINTDGCNARGCDKGLKGRHIISEIMTLDTVFADMIGQGAVNSELLKYQRTNLGFKDMWSDAFRLIQEGVISPYVVFDRLGPPKDYSEVENILSKQEKENAVS